MKLQFTIDLHLGDDVVFAPAVDGKFLASELAAYATKLATFYTASSEAPEVAVSVPEIKPPTKVTIV